MSTPLEVVHAVFRYWFGEHYDLDILDTVMAVQATARYLEGDPVWLLLVGGAGVGKTETLSSIRDSANVHVVSTIGSEASLLSGSPVKKASATGGLMREIGPKGTLVLKDFTTILSMRHEARAELLAALREIYDGLWVRTLGTHGGEKLTWEGRCTLIGGVTSVYDEYYSVVATMGDRFLLRRHDSESDEVRRAAMRKCMTHEGGEKAMRDELAKAVADFLGTVTVTGWVPIDDDAADALMNAADTVAWMRSQVAADHNGDPLFAHAPEFPTRIVKQLSALYQGALMIGKEPEEALGLAQQVAHDCLPPGRRDCLKVVLDTPGLTTSAVARATGMARRSTDRYLQQLALFDLVEKRSEFAGMGVTLEGEVSTVEEHGRWLWYPSSTRFVDESVLRR